MFSGYPNRETSVEEAAKAEETDSPSRLSMTPVRFSL
jgi:hypothetical protein